MSDAALGAIVLVVLLFLIALRRSGERAGRLAERLKTSEKVNDVQRQMLDAAARRPRDRDDENGGEKVDHGSGGIVPLRAA